MKTIKLYSLLVFFTPFFILLILFLGIVTLFRIRASIVKQLANIYEDIILRNAGFISKEQKDFFDNLLEIAVHTSLISWISLLVLLLP